MRYAPALALLLLAGPQEITPRWKFDPDKPRRFRKTVKVVSEQETSGAKPSGMTIEMTYEFVLKVRQKNPSGRATVEVCFEKIKQRVRSPLVTLTFDSEKPGDLERAKSVTQLKKVAAMVGRSLTAEIDDCGKVHAVKQPAGAGALPFDKSELQQMFLEFPKKALEAGDSWTLTTEKDSGSLPMTVETAFILKEVKGAKAFFSGDSKVRIHPGKAKSHALRRMKLKAFKGSSTFGFALDEGVLESMETNTEMILTLESRGLVHTSRTESKLELLPAGK